MVALAGSDFFVGKPEHVLQAATSGGGGFGGTKGKTFSVNEPVQNFAT